ncbi:MAG: hypothetical protein HC871_08090 [Rhizobiales bacterium]|nr:hypothetical protein [Hyphomicrobiales bacterium]
MVRSGCALPSTYQPTRSPPSPAKRARDDGVGDDPGELDRSDQLRSGVEADPADPEDDGAQAHQHGVMAGYAAWQPAASELAAARADHDDRRERHPAAGRMHHGRAGKVDIAAIGEKGRAFGKEQIAPGPMSEDRIDHGRDQDRDDQVGVEGRALGDRSGDDGRRGAAEDELESEEAQQRKIAVGDREEGIADQGGAGRAEHDAEAEQIVTAGGEHEVAEILLRDIDRVLGAHHARFEQQKAALHAEHQGRGHGQPDGIQVIAKAKQLLADRGGGAAIRLQEGQELAQTAWFQSGSPFAGVAPVFRLRRRP